MTYLCNCVPSTQELIQLVLRRFENNHGAPVPVYAHGKNVHEVMIHAPVASEQIKLVANRYGINMESLNHARISTRRGRFHP